MIWLMYNLWNPQPSNRGSPKQLQATSILQSWQKVPRRQLGNKRNLTWSQKWSNDHDDIRTGTSAERALVSSLDLYPLFSLLCPSLSSLLCWRSHGRAFHFYTISTGRFPPAIKKKKEKKLRDHALRSVDCLIRHFTQDLQGLTPFNILLQRPLLLHIIPHTLTTDNILYILHTWLAKRHICIFYPFCFVF